MAQNIRRFRANFGFRHYFLSRVHLKCFGILPNCSFGCSDPALVVNIINCTIPVCTFRFRRKCIGLSMKGIHEKFLRRFFAGDI